MSIYDGKANYHPVSQLAGNLTNGSYVLPGNGYYSVTGTPPQVKFDHTQSISDPKYRFSQSHRIDPLHSLLSLKEGTTLTPYSDHNPPVEQCRDRYIFVPKFTSFGQPGIPDPNLVQFKQSAEDPSNYRLNDVKQLPDVDYNVLPERSQTDEVYRLYKTDYPYDMMVLRETRKFNPPRDGSYDNYNPNFVSTTTIVPRP